MNNVWLIGAFLLMLGLVPCGIVAFTKDAANRLVGLEAGALLLVLTMMLLAEGYHRTFLFDLALMMAVLSFGGGLVFVRFLERWL
ncbi:MAG TPA: monovalent cation/H+ antiporter complex subunit F [Terriglobia bacterium]|nr:monovalent cation/H+ antiporter complex subunit F [Terriglobia bacterium]